MKKAALLALFMLVAILLGGCSGEIVPSVTVLPSDDANSESAVEIAAEPSVVPSADQIITFRVNEEMPLYECAVDISEPENGSNIGHIDQMIITEAEGGSNVQTFQFEDDLYNQDFMKSAAYFVDITFDGCLDLLVPRERSARYIGFEFYLWDNESKQFVEHETLDMLLNPSIDYENNLILSRTSGDQQTSYTMISIKNIEAVSFNWFFWEPVCSFNEVGDRPIYCRESRMDNGVDTIVNEFTVKGEDFLSPPKTDPETQPYFAPGSFWDLDNAKWDCPYWEELKDK